MQSTKTISFLSNVLTLRKIRVVPYKGLSNLLACFSSPRKVLRGLQSIGMQTHSDFNMFSAVKGNTKVYMEEVQDADDIEKYCVVEDVSQLVSDAELALTTLGITYKRVESCYTDFKIAYDCKKELSRQLKSMGYSASPYRTQPDGKQVINYKLNGWPSQSRIMMTISAGLLLLRV
jgi:hypothetical protein